MKFIKKSFLLYIIAISGISVFLNGCNEGPTQLGYSLITDTVSVVPISSLDSKILVGTDTYYRHINNFLNSLLIGSSGENKAVSFIRFGSIPDTLGYLTEANIQSVKITMSPMLYTLGDTVQNKLAFNAFAITREWSNYTSWDSLFISGMGSSDYIDLSKPLGGYNQTIPIQDSGSITFDLDKSIVLYWFRQPSDSTRHGLALVPDTANSTVIRQFKKGIINSIEGRPVMTVIYTDKNNKTDTLVVASVMDTFFANAPSYDTKSLTVEGGVGLLGRMTIDVSMIPRNAGIHYAVLELTIDPSKSKFGNTGRDSLIEVDLLSDSSISSNITHYSYSDAVGQNVDLKSLSGYRFSALAPMIDYIVRNGGKGYLLFHTYTLTDYTKEIDLTAFYGIDNPDPAKRPKLTIYYSLIQNKK